MLASPTFAQTDTLLLHDAWEFARVGGDVEWRSAEVPGCVHMDLLRHGLLPDPFAGTNEDSIQWVENEDWVYRTNFKLTAAQLRNDEALLVFDGLDTYADVYLNDKLVLRSDNMFVGYEVPVRQYLKRGENELRILFHSPINHVMPQWEAAGFNYPADNDHAEKRMSVFSRKAPFHYGWDWGIRMVTSGIWRPAKLVFCNKARIADVYVRQSSISPELAQTDNKICIKALQDEALTIRLTASHGNFKQEFQKTMGIKKGENTIDVRLDIVNPSLWWPNGMGEQPLYDFKVQLLRGKTLLDERTRKIGLRKMEVGCEKDSLGESFFFRVNGNPVYAKGANYIPGDVLLPRVTKEKYHRFFEDVRRSNLNMIRVWGGGIYEDDYFYHLADSLGIMIWQDFMFACTPYPADSAFLSRVEAEADYNIRRLRNHASLAMWCGNNEILEALKYWGLRRRFSSEVYESFFVAYDKLFRNLLPRKVTELDDRFYVHGSPYEANWGRPELFAIRDAHDWGVWQGGLPFEALAERLPRFASEFGFQSMPEMKTIRTFASPADYDFNSEVMRAHQKSYVGSKVIADYIGRYYNAPQSFEEFVYLSQVMQGMGMRMGIEAQRRSRPYCMGSLYWQINDCWPVVSWSGIDSYGNWKALQYQAARAFASPALSVQAEGDRLLYYIMCDELKPQAAVCRTTLMDFKGRIIKTASDQFTIPANASALFAEKDEQEWGADSANTFLLLEIETPDGLPICNYIYYFCKPKHLRLPVPKLQKQVEWGAERCVVTLCSDVLVKDGFLETPWQGASYSDNFFDLLPGEVKRVEIMSPLITSEAASDSCISLIYLNKLSKP